VHGDSAKDDANNGDRQHTNHEAAQAALVNPQHRDARAADDGERVGAEVQDSTWGARRRGKYSLLHLFCDLGPYFVN
jgi:hypothetical protein